MDWRVLIGTFGLIFLAELGDKTQLTVLAFSAGSRATWSVLLGASLALICSTMMAVLLGTLMRDQSLVPMSWIRLVAGLLFLVFGALTLREAFAPSAPEPPADIEEAAAGEGLLTSVLLASAAAFESASQARYQDLSESASLPGLARLWQHLADEEANHLEHLNGLGRKHEANFIDALLPAVDAEKPTVDGKRTITEDQRSLLKQLIAEESDTVRFYEHLAAASIIPSLRRTFRFLAEEERSHVAHLEAVAAKDLF